MPGTAKEGQSTTKSGTTTATPIRTCKAQHIKSSGCVQLVPSQRHVQLWIQKHASMHCARHMNAARFADRGRQMVM